MQIKRLVIENFKSIERIELIEPNPFTVFVGPNGSGKSNIFEALEFMYLANATNDLVEDLFGGQEGFLNRRSISNSVAVGVDLGGVTARFVYDTKNEEIEIGGKVDSNATFSGNFKALDKFLENFSRLFIKNTPLQKLSLNNNKRLSLAASNLEKVLKRILSNDVLKREIFEWLEIFVPSFKAVEIDDRDELHWFETAHRKYFTKDLISDGTYNILALLTAVFQSEEPQFLCIEEPENGLNPKVTRELVHLFRFACEEYGHYIWLNTHSQSLVSVLTPEEIILVDKVDGATKTKQVAGMNLHGLPMDEAWLSNALGGGIPW
ncbi:AAA family ATPase [Fibrella aquatica]|jgi:predicted ATPase|uniref:AAA family ATPase n=1 Tax=Fibrella aquatica TaxID=3242487 RepID=UPI003522A264